MSLSVLRTVDGWWVLTASGAVRVSTSAQTTADLLADRDAVRAAAGQNGGVDPAGLELLSPVTAPCRVVAQMTNYVSHVRDSGMDPETVPMTFFRKASGSISSPTGDVVKPAHVRFLDYEVEIGLVMGREVPVGTTITAADLDDLIAGLVVTNDVSARDLQLPKTQFFESKSYPTFTPVGPVLLLLEPGELARFADLRLRLTVNGEVRQDSTAEEMIYRPAEVLAALNRFQQLAPGDLLLTGTPGGTALKAPAKVAEIVGNLLPPAMKWKAFFKSQAANPKYLADGDLVEVSIATDDGILDLGTQRTRVRYA
jgi:2-keto-4-pentenoate hydratase/2-oxohepta-3-ene-1,7-dioic acid hydratase in catechol pathway